MKLRKFNRGTQVSRGVSDIPYFSISRKGIIRLNTKAMDLLGVEPTDKINVYNDEERPADWYVEKTNEPEGLIMRKCSGGGVICNSAGITGNILKALRIDKENTATMRIAPNPIEEGSTIYAILTGSAARK